jgi:alcohol dehydrogenase class IV
MNFEFATAGKIIFGSGALNKLPEYIIEYGKNPFIIICESGKLRNKILDDLHYANLQPSIFTVRGEPDINKIREGVNFALESKADVIISIGGGSVIDTGKAVSALLTNEGEIFDYLEVIGKGKPLRNPTIPFIAIPTTAGTGSEVTSNAVLFSPEHKVKVSIRSKFMFPDIALIDPSLSITMPPNVTASSGLDALVQLVEAYTSNKSNPFTDSICREGISRAARSLKIAYLNGEDISAREDMAIAAMFSGIALSNAKLGAVHGIAGPLGGMLNIPHGVICAKFFQKAFEINLNALNQRKPGSPVIERFREIAAYLSGKEMKKITIEDCPNILMEFLSSYELPSIKSYGFTEEMISELVQKSRNSSSMKGNPVELTEDEIREIIETAIN